MAFCAAVPFTYADHVGEKDNGLSIQEERYLHLYKQAYEEFGKDVGANLVDDGTGRYEPYDLPNELVAEKAAVLDRWLNPPAPEPVQAEPTSEYVEPEPAPVSSPAPSSGGYAIPDYIVQCESGGDYNAQNPSGAYGAYQIMPGTAAAYGCDLSSPAGQDQCAGEIYAAEGASPWVCG